MGSVPGCSCDCDQACPPDINICQRQRPDDNDNSLPLNPLYDGQIDGQIGIQRGSLNDRRTIADSTGYPSPPSPVPLTSRTSENDQSELSGGLLDLMNVDTLTMIQSLEQLIPTPTEDYNSSESGDIFPTIPPIPIFDKQQISNEYKSSSNRGTPSPDDDVYISHDTRKIPLQNIESNIAIENMPMDPELPELPEEEEEEENWIPTTAPELNQRISDMQIKAALMEKYELSQSQSISDDSSYSQSEEETKEETDTEKKKLNVIVQDDDDERLSPSVTPEQTVMPKQSDLPKVSSIDEKERHLVRTKSKDKWDDKHMGDLEDEMRTQMLTLQGGLLQEPDESSLFRIGSQHKWTDDSINAQREEMGKQMMHLIENSTETELEQLSKGGKD